MAETILHTSSISTRTKELRINRDDSIVYIDHYEHGKLVAAFTIRAADWDAFILSEYVEIQGGRR